MKEPINCPHCGEELKFETISRLSDNCRMQFRIKPHDGQLLSAATVAGALGNLDKLLKALGREHGVKQSVSIEGIETDESGEVTISILAARAEQKGKEAT